jgi:hypothetical protein
MERDLTHSPKVPESAHPGALVARHRRRSHPVRPLSARLQAARRPARRLLRPPERRRPDDPDDLWPFIRLLHRPDREEAAQPLLSRHRRFCRSAPQAATWRASSARTGTSRSRRTWTGYSTPPAPRASPAPRSAYGAQSVAFTYNDPVIFAEYAIDTAVACHELGVKTVAVTAGYIHAEPAPSSSPSWTAPTST